MYEIPVGPVHAGVIEPGHFRFNCIGERVLHLEIHLGYQHRGIEKLIPQVSPARLPSLIEGIAGDTAVGHSLCFTQAVEALTDRRPDSSARILRTIGLELEQELLRILAGRTLYFKRDISMVTHKDIHPSAAMLAFMALLRKERIRYQ